MKTNAFNEPVFFEGDLDETELIGNVQQLEDMLFSEEDLY